MLGSSRRHRGSTEQQHIPVKKYTGNVENDISVITSSTRTSKRGKKSSVVDIKKSSSENLSKGFFCSLGLPLFAVFGIF